MLWQDIGYILKAAPMGERSLLVDVLTLDHGRVRGVVQPTRLCPRGLFLPGAKGSLTYKARLSEQLGGIVMEPSTSLVAQLFKSPYRLSLVQALATLLTRILPVHHSYNQIFKAFSLLIEEHSHQPTFAADYLIFEVMLLQELGFGLNLSACALTGTQEDLAYVSPRTGAAASRAAGLPYHTKLLPLPAFLIHHQARSTATPHCLQAGEKLCSHFLQRHFFNDTPSALWQELRRPLRTFLATCA